MLKLFKFFSINYTFLQIKKFIYLFKYRKLSLSLGLGSVIKESNLGMNNYIGNNVMLFNSKIGNYSYINSNSIIRDTKIGNFTSIGPGVKIVLGRHPIHFISTHPSFYSNNKPFTTFTSELHIEEYLPVTIGNDVWIGEDVLIPGGVKIGDGAVLLARSVVTKDVEPYAVYGGTPAKLIKYRFDKIEIEKLLEIKWWDKSESWLKENASLFRNKNLFFTHLK
ncbi:MAG: CatB-related O-acetyltransferase [Bacteroidetes bacterium]|jgi:chloramphenicol O-acetyltransferase type B|nr:CatB-related O-acetyltransferase [Bacteroidota bacterium]